MFTGLVEEVGTIQSIVETGGNHRITIHAPNSAQRAEGRQQRRGERRLPYRAQHQARLFCADLAAETWARTSLSRITQGAQVNLELPLRADGRWADTSCRAMLTASRASSAWSQFPTPTISGCISTFPEELEKYVVFKGSISMKASA